MKEHRKYHHQHSFNAIDSFAIVLAAAVHDVGHPGNNNGFEVSAHTKLALIYNDRSVLENYHCSEAFITMTQDKDCNVLGDLIDDERNAIRHVMIESILATDMTKHFEIIGKWNAKLEAKNFNFDVMEDKSLALCVIIKMADIGHTSKPLELHKLWTASLSEEFYRQGDRGVY